MPNRLEMISGGRINKDTIEIVAIVDKSGSMQRIKEDAIGGLNAFIEEQQKVPGKANMTIIFFSSGLDYKTIEEYTPLEEVKTIEDGVYVPRGGTALLDAIGRTIDDMLKTFESLPKDDIPNKVIFVIITDGEERDSTVYTHEQIMKKIEEQEEKGWSFEFLSAGKDAIQEGRSFGVKLDKIKTFAKSSVGIRSAYTCATESVTAYRTNDNSSKQGN